MGFLLGAAREYDPLMWSVADVADALEAGFTREDARLREEQAVYGLDALDELDLHPVIARAFEGAAYGVFREQRYPADRRMTRESEGERCDFVLTPTGRELMEPDKPETLFDAPDSVPLEDAFWLEIKIAHQFTIAGPNPRYGAGMLSVARRDVRKLSKDRTILHAGLGMIAFVEDERIGRHDLNVWYERAIARGLPVGFPAVRSVEIQNRLGHGVCAIAIAPISHL